jgi:hypothetical protein
MITLTDSSQVATLAKIARRSVTAHTYSTKQAAPKNVTHASASAFLVTWLSLTVHTTEYKEKANSACERGS